MTKVLIGISLVVSLSVHSLADKNADNKIISDKTEMVGADFQMPSAGDLVNSLTKSLGKITWNTFVPPVSSRKYTSNEELVLNLGVRGADIYFLTASQDSANIIAISTEVNYLLNEIMLNNKSLNTNARRAKLVELRDLVSRNDWKAVHKEITVLQNSIDADFINGNSKGLMILNNVGGWIEGYRLAVEGFNQNYKADKTEILLQNDLIAYLHGELSKEPTLKAFDKTPLLIKTLGDINGILQGAANEQLTKAQIEQLLAVLNEAKKYI